jgi:hypothetical protein
MTQDQVTAMQRLEGHEVSIALRDGSRIDAAALMSAGQPDRPTVWVYSNGRDVFIPAADVRAVWETHGPHALTE